MAHQGLHVEALVAGNFEMRQNLAMSRDVAVEVAWALTVEALGRRYRSLCVGVVVGG